MRKPGINQLADVLGRFLIASMLFCSLSCTLWEALSLSALKSAGSAMMLVGAAVCLLLCAVSADRRARVISYIMLAAILTVVAVVASRYISDGLSVVFNRVFLGFETLYGRIFPYFKTGLTRSGYSLCASAFLFYPVAFIAVCAARAACLPGTAWRFAFPALAALVWAGALIFRLPVSGVPPVLLGLALAGMRARSIMLGATASGADRAVLPVMLALALSAVVLAAPFSLVMAGRSHDAGKLREFVAGKAHGARYHVADSPMPEGDFARLGDFVPEDAIDLYVTADDPKPMYLRGFVGERYVNGRWERLAPKALGSYAAAFSWMHTADFYGQTQYAALAGAMGLSTGASTVRVENLSACSCYEFVPYALCMFPDGRRDRNAIGDICVKSKGLHGDRDYEIAVSDFDIDRYDALYASLVDAGDVGAYEYLKFEGAYREFAYNEYLAVPAAARASVRRLPDVADVPPGTRASFAEACRIVLNSLLNDFAYDEAPGETPEGWDFAAWFLDGSKIGYSPHFATAATLIFRELGVPARYVEGYAIRALQAASAQDGKMEVPRANAHAWAEIYRDGVGFIPFEATPPFVSETPKSSNPKPDGPGSSDTGTEAETEPGGEPADVTADMLFLILMIILASLLASAAYVAIRRMVVKRRRDMLFRDADNAEAVCWLTAYAVMLLGHIGLSRRNGSLLKLVPEAELLFGPEFAKAFTEAIYAQREAMFGNASVSDDRRAAAGAFAGEVLKKLKQTLRMRKKAYLMWIMCAY